jgi:hypothetical protein
MPCGLPAAFSTPHPNLCAQREFESVLAAKSVASVYVPAPTYDTACSEASASVTSKNARAGATTAFQSPSHGKWMSPSRGMNRARGDRVLDIGCGLGEEILRISKVTGPNGRLMLIRMRPPTLWPRTGDAAGTGRRIHWR